MIKSKQNIKGSSKAQREVKELHKIPKHSQKYTKATKNIPRFWKHFMLQIYSFSMIKVFHEKIGRLRQACFRQK